jgi:FtsP/CotA-like multicopper oxidase with cupredoxin domain
MSVAMVDETANVAANTTVTAANGNFILVVPSNHSYMLLFRDAATGKTIAPLIVDKLSGRVGFSLPNGSADVDLSNISINSQLGKAWCWVDPTLARPTASFPLTLIAWTAVSNIPTDAPASPLFGATAFSQQMLLFEEFGPEAMPAVVTPGFTPLPQPVNSASGPDPTLLGSFLAQPGVAPFPTEASNTTDTNPWKAKIETFLGHALVAPPGSVAGPAEGRPSGADWSHQSFNDFFPKRFYKTSIAQARDNDGLRDTRQRHGYASGEFAVGGLYHNTAGIPATDGTTKGISIRLHPNMPVQDVNSVWTFDGTLPPKLLQVRYGEPIMMRNYNMLPIDATANNGFGRNTITTHEHNGHQPGESDGFAGAFFFPGEFWDYQWPLQLAGYSNNNNSAGAINAAATEGRAATPCAMLPVPETLDVIVNGVKQTRTCAGGTIMLPGDWRETMSTHWFHDHMLDFTAHNVYKGNAAMMNYYSALDRGNEAVNDGVNLRFPSGTALEWGNRDYDVNLLVADKATNGNGQLFFNTAQHNGFLGDIMTVNWLYKPYLDVRARSYRFRILNGSVSRIIAIALVQQVAGAGGEFPGPAGSGVSYNRIPFHFIANDGNILEHTVPFDGVARVPALNFPAGTTADTWKGQLPTQGIAERYDIIVNFAKNGINVGDKLYFVNVNEHLDGLGSKGRVPLASILNGTYNPVVNAAGIWINGDPGVGKFLEFRVQPYTGTDLAMNPADFEPGKLAMIPLPIVRGATTAAGVVNGVPLTGAVHHTFEFAHGNPGVPVGHGEPWEITVDGGLPLTMDQHRVQAIENGDLQVWRIKGFAGWTHPVHIHFEEGYILSRGGVAPPEWEKWARKDMYRVGPEVDSTTDIEIAYRSRDFLGDYVEHCHNTMHEDHAMLLRWDARHTGAALVPTPMPTFDGVFFEPTFPLTGGTNSNLNAITGDGVGVQVNVPN